jgi:hypothetical protein
MQVPIIRTVCSPKVYAAAFIRAWKFLEGSFPTKEQCGVLYAQWMVETSGKDCWNWNIGNKKVSQAQVDAGVPWIDLPGTWEKINGQRVVLKEGDPGRRFRAYASLDAGMAEHLASLKNKWATSWPAVKTGDTSKFAHALKAGKDGIEGTYDDYFTADAEDYARIMGNAFNVWMRSSAFEDALAEVTEASEAETDPEIKVEWATVHAAVPLPKPDPPPDAA